jgi:hypothetical protein
MRPRCCFLFFVGKPRSHGLTVRGVKFDADVLASRCVSNR